MSNHTATYSPEDDKIRIYPAYRLDKDTEYARVKSAGFAWAPKQECFYAVWSPLRESIALEFAETIEDEDKSLVDRAEERADRFENYSENRANDAERAHKAVASIADNIPFGQPILVGHHSEKRARKDAEKIENGMRKAVQLFDTAEYWTRRAASAISHAKYKERPDVRARRIKGLESDKRKQEKYKIEAEKALEIWSREDLTLEFAIKIAGSGVYGRFTMARKEGDKPDFNQSPDAYTALSNSYPTLYAPRTLDEVVETAKRVYPRSIAHCNVWIDHINNRLAYEKTMLAEGGGLAADKFDIQLGGQVKRRGSWHVILKLNKKAGVLQSVTVAGIGWDTVKMEEIQDYLPPEEGDTEKVKKATALPPMCNYKIDGCATMTQAEFTATYKDHKGSEIIAATDTQGRHRVRTIASFLARRHGSDTKDQWGPIPVFISDAKEKLPPAPEKDQAPRELPATPAPAPRPVYVAPEPTEAECKADELRKQLKAGVKVVSAPQLFPTPAPLAARMVELADIKPGMTVLEPSAGTGRIIQAVMDTVDTEIVAFEINQALCNQLSETFPSYVLQARCRDFLEVTDNAGQWERILMNPPFEKGIDIKHIKHAYELLKPGGKLVAICAGGPRQAEQLKPLSDTWEALPAGTFEESGTGVNTVLLTMSKAEEVKADPLPVYMEKSVNESADFQLTFEPVRYPTPARVQHVRARQANLFQ